MTQLFQNLIFWSLLTTHPIKYMPPPGVAVKILKVSVDRHYNPFFLSAQVYEESRYKKGQVSSSGCTGLMQVSSQVKERYHTQDSLVAGVGYMKHLLRRFHGNHTQALVAYNEGPTLASSGTVLPLSRRYAWNTLKIQKQLTENAISLKILEAG